MNRLLTLFVLTHTIIPFVALFALIFRCAAGANIVIGFIQAGLSETSHLSIPAWRLLYVVNGAMTVVVALAGYFLVRQALIIHRLTP